MRLALERALDWVNSPLSLLGWIVLPLVWLVADGSVRSLYNFEKAFQAMESETALLHSANEELRLRIELLKSPQGKETLARERLGLVGPQDLLFVFAPPSNTQ